MVSAALVNVLPAGLVGGDSDSVLCCELFAGVFYGSGSSLNCGSLGKLLRVFCCELVSGDSSSAFCCEMVVPSVVRWLAEALAVPSVVR